MGDGGSLGTSDVLVIQNAQMEGLGTLGDMLESDGFSVRIIHAKHEPLPEDPRPALLVILGGPESANDELRYLQDEQDLVRKCTCRKTPVLGICLGSQLIARAFGATVTRGRCGPETGFLDNLRPDRDSGLFSGFSDPFCAFHWHADTFELPRGATRLVSSDTYENQAFRIGTAVGMQFHLEVDRKMVGAWLDDAESGSADSSVPRPDVQTIRGQLSPGISKAESNMGLFYRNFRSEFGL